jgi:hypothetical protein
VCAEIEDEMTRVVERALAAKAMFLRQAQHPAVAPHDLHNQARNAAFAGSRN